MKEQGRPNEKDIQAFYDHYKDVWGTTWQQWQQYDSFYWRTFEVWPKNPNRPSFRPSRPASFVDHAVDNQIGYVPSITRPAHRKADGSENEQDQVRADQVEPFVLAVLEDCALREAVQTWKQVGRHMVQYGTAVVEGPTIDWSSRPAELRRAEGESDDEWGLRQRMRAAEMRNWNPFRIRAPHPARVLCDPYLKQPTEAVKLESILARDLHELSLKKTRTRRNAQVWEIPNDKKPFDKVVILRHWLPGWHTVMELNGEIIYAERNPLGYVPILLGYAGFGQQPTETEEEGPEHFAIGILHHILESLRIDAQNFSAKHNILVNAAFPVMGTRRSPDELQQALAKGDIAEGEKEDYWVMATPTITKWMFEEGSEVVQDLEIGSYASSLAGRRPMGVSTVGQQQILTTQALKKFTGISQQMEDMASIVAGRILRLVEVLDETVTVRGKTLRPEQVGHDYTVEVKFELLDPVMDLQNRQVGMQEVDRGLIDPTTYRSNYARLEDETGVQKRLIKARLMAHPAVQEMMVRKVAEEEGLLDIIEQWEREQQAQQEMAAAGGQGSNGRKGMEPVRQGLSPGVGKPAPARPGGFTTGGG